MAHKTERVAYCLTFLLKKEGEVWASVTPEMGTASCGDSLEHAREMLKDAIRARLRVMTRRGWADHLWNRMSPEQIADFRTDPPGEVMTESHVMVVTTLVAAAHEGRRPSVRVEFVRAAAPASEAVFSPV